ncbi:MAG: hypothetical protein AB8C02_06185 [Halioglobus sp.]
MMLLSQILEDFSPLLTGIVDKAPQPSEMSDELKLKYYEDGYGAGWEDAVKAQENSAETLFASLNQAVTEVTFTRDEALDVLSTKVGELAEAIVLHFVPHLTDTNFTSMIVQTVTDEFNSIGEQRIGLQVSNDNYLQLNESLPETLKNALLLECVDKLPDGQVSFNAGSSEKMLDFDGLVDRLKDHIISYQNSITQEKNSA